MLVVKKGRLTVLQHFPEIVPSQVFKISENTYVKTAKMSEMWFAKKTFWKFQLNLSNILVEEFIS